MLFKRKITVEKYLSTRPDLLFSPEQTERWLKIKESCGDREIFSLREDIYLTHLRAAHIRLLLMVLTKKYYRNDELLFEIEMFVDDYLEGHDDGMVKNFDDQYASAIASEQDGVLGMAKAMMGVFSLFCEQKTLLGFRALFYDAIAGFRSDLKQVKLTIAQ